MNEKSIVANMFIEALSNNSHELFHSNFWAWLIKVDPNYCKCFFNRFKNEPIKVAREKDHFDISIITENDIYVIENKFKSIPTKEQLEKYEKIVSKKYQNNNKHFLLVTPFKNTTISKNWKCIDYISVLKKIKSITESSNNKEIKRYKLVILDYCDYFIDLIKDIEDYIKHYDKYYVLEYTDKPMTLKTVSSLMKYNQNDLINKLSAEKFVCDFKTYVNKKNKNKIKILCDTNFNNKKATMDFNICGNNNKKIFGGISIEGYQYRRCIFINKKLAGNLSFATEKIKDKKQLKNLENLLEPFIKNDWLSYSQPKDMRVLMGKYNMTDWYVLYQHHTIKMNKANLELYEEILNDLVKLSSINRKEK